jgi:hypothetical protein
LLPVSAVSHFPHWQWTIILGSTKTPEGTCSEWGRGKSIWPVDKVERNKQSEVRVKLNNKGEGRVQKNNHSKIKRSKIASAKVKKKNRQIWSPTLEQKKPESKMAMMIPRPSKEGFLERKEMAPVSLLGCRAQQGNLSILLSATKINLFIPEVRSERNRVRSLIR